MINPGIWGKRLAEFLVSQLPNYGVSTREFYAEDWGWEIPVDNDSFPLFLGCSNQIEPGGNDFLCFIDPSKPEVRRWIFKKVSTIDDIERVAEALDRTLRAHPDIENLHWWTDDGI